MKELRTLAVEKLRRGRYQPRQHFDQEKLQELAASIKTTQGLLQPIVVRPLDDGLYEIIAGERRWRASQLAGLSEVSCLIGQYSDDEALEASIIENVSRADLNPIEEAQAYQRMIDDFGYIHEEIAATVGKSRAKISNALRLLKLDAEVKKLLTMGELSEGHGKLLVSLAPAQQYPLACQCISKQWSVRQLEKEVRKRLAVDKKTASVDPNVKALERSLAAYVGSKVSIDVNEQGKGQLKVDFHDLEILQGVLEKIGMPTEYLENKRP